MGLLCKWGGKYRGSLLAENWFELLPKTDTTKLKINSQQCPSIITHLINTTFNCKSELNYYLGSLSKSSKRGTPFSKRLWYKQRLIISLSKTSPVSVIRSKVRGWTLKPRNVMLVWSGLKNMYGWGLQETQMLHSLSFSCLHARKNTQSQMSSYFRCKYLKENEWLVRKKLKVKVSW